MDLSNPHPSSLIPHPSTGGARPSLVYSPHPLQPARGRELLRAEFEPGETLGGYLERTGIAARIRHRPVQVTIDGLRVPRAIWQHCRPKPGTLIQVQALVHGGGDGDGKNPIATVLTIALMVAAPYLAPGLAAGMGVTSVWGIAAVQVGIGIVGGMAINALFPAPNPQLSQSGNLGQPESPTYSVSGGSNRMRRYEPMPVIMGAHRVFPDLGAQTYTTFGGEDQYLYQVFDFGYNDLDLSDYRIGTNPIANFSDVTLQESGADGALTLFPINVDSQAGAVLEYGADYTIRNSSPGTTKLEIELTGFLFNAATGDGSVIATTCALELEYRAIGSATWLPFVFTHSEFVLLNNTRRPLRYNLQRDVASGQYEVRAKRTTVVDANPLVVRDITWSQLRSFQPDTADYTGRKRVALKIKASGQLNGQVAQFSAIARAKTSVWNGAAWVTAQTSNPAWWVLAAVRGKYVGSRRVWGGGIPDARTDLENIKAFGAWCDSKSLTFNGVFDRQMSVYDMISAIALQGRGTVSYGSGLLEVVWDAPDQAAVAVFGMSNIKLDTFEIEYSTAQLADEIVATFVNPDIDWQQDVVRVLAPGVTDPVRSRSVDLFGCTNKVEAGHTVNLYVAANIHRTKRYRWQMDWEGMPVSRGDVGYLSHDLASYDYSGRLIEGSTASVLKLERTVPLDAAGSFVTLVKPDGTFATYPVQAGTGDASTLNLVSALAFNPGADADHPPYDYRWLYGNTATPGKKIKIEAFAVKGYDTVELTAIDETADYYASEDNPYTHVPVRAASNVIFAPTTPLGDPSAPAIPRVDLSYDGVRVAAGYVVAVTAFWAPGGNFNFADVRVAVNGGALRLLGQEIRARSFDFTIPDNSDVIVEVTGFGNLARLGNSSKVSAALHVNFSALFPPSDVQGFALEGKSFSWAVVPDVDVAGYRIRFHYNNLRSWDDANELNTGLITSSPVTFPELPANQMTYGIKAVDAAGLESAAAAWITVDARLFTPEGDPLVANVVETIDFQALDWPGTLTGGTVSGAGNLEATSGTVFYNEEGVAPMYGADNESFYKQDNFDALSFESDPFVLSGALVGSRMTIDHAIAGEPIYVEYRQTGPNSLYGVDADSFYGADADPFYEMPGGYAVWPGAIISSNEEYQIRVRTGQGAVQGVVSDITAVIDAPDIVETFDDVAIDAAGTRLPITRNYQVIKNVQVTLQNDAGTAVTATIEDKSATLGPLIKARDSSQVAVTATVDATVQGY
jgi:hypothetical protein